MPLDLDLPPDLSHAARSNRHLADQVAETSIGALAAQKAIDELRSGADRETAWLRFTELAACRGWKSTAARAFVLELAKRIA